MDSADVVENLAHGSEIIDEGDDAHGCVGKRAVKRKARRYAPAASPTDTGPRHDGGAFAGRREKSAPVRRRQERAPSPQRGGALARARRNKDDDAHAGGGNSARRSLMISSSGVSTSAAGRVPGAAPRTGLGFHCDRPDARHRAGVDAPAKGGRHSSAADVRVRIRSAPSMRTEPSTEKPPSCAQARISAALSWSIIRPRLTKVEDTGPHACSMSANAAASSPRVA